MAAGVRDEPEDSGAGLWADLQKQLAAHRRIILHLNKCK
jgi:hypothetical protein